MDIYEGDPYPLPQADSGLPDGNLSTQGLGQGILNDSSVMDWIEEILDKKESEANNRQNRNQDPEEGPLSARVHQIWSVPLKGFEDSRVHGFDSFRSGGVGL